MRQAQRVCARCGHTASPSQTACGRCFQPFGRTVGVQLGAQNLPGPGPVHAGGAAACRADGVGANAQSGPLTRRQIAAIALLLIVLFAMACAMSLGLQAFRAWLAPLPTITIVSTGGAAGRVVADEGPVRSPQINERLLAASANTGEDLEICMAWNALSDLDLSVRDASGELIWARHPRSASGGEMDVDANPTVAQRDGVMVEDPKPQDVLPLTEAVVARGGYLNAADRNTVRLDGMVRSVYTHTPVEHIYFRHAAKGRYTVYAHCFLWREKCRQPLAYSLQVRSRGRAVRELAGRLGPEDHVTDRTEPVAVCTFEVA